MRILVILQLIEPIHYVQSQTAMSNTPVQSLHPLAPRRPRDPLRIMDLLRDAQWRTYTRGSPFDRRYLDCRNRGTLNWPLQYDIRGCNTQLTPNHSRCLRLALSLLTLPLAFHPPEESRSRCHFSENCCHCPKDTQTNANRSIWSWSLLSCRDHEPGRGQTRQLARGTSRLLRLC